MFNCKHCNASLHEDYRYCHTCGRPVDLGTSIRVPTKTAAYEARCSACNDGLVEGAGLCGVCLDFETINSVVI